MIEGAELDGPYQFPMMPRYTGRPGTDTVDFKDSFDRRIKNHRDLTVNFYIHDNQFEKIWNCPDKYIEHLKCFNSVIAPDFSMAVGEGGMPFAMNIWQKYRNHAIAHYLYARYNFYHHRHVYNVFYCRSSRKYLLARLMRQILY